MCSISLAFPYLQIPLRLYSYVWFFRSSFSVRSVDESHNVALLGLRPARICEDLASRQAQEADVVIRDDEVCVALQAYNFRGRLGILSVHVFPLISIGSPDTLR